jgi:hypothetical protein
VALYFLTFGALAASAICGISDTSKAAAAGIIIFRIFIGIRIHLPAINQHFLSLYLKEGLND